jgi:phosphoribosylamine---glycine ligase
MIPVLYKGSVKDVLGPVYASSTKQSEIASALFCFTNSFSVFDWGKMPDQLPGKGAALAVLGAHFFEELEKPETWKSFSRTSEALALRKGVSALSQKIPLSRSARKTGESVSMGSVFNEMGEDLQKHGLKTHYLGASTIDPSQDAQEALRIQKLGRLETPFSVMAVRQVNIAKPEQKQILGRSVLDYQPTLQAKAPKLVPLEVVFRFSLPEGSSFLKRVERNPSYLDELAIPAELKESGKIGSDSHFEFPILELFTKLEDKDRPVSFTEALNMSGISAESLEEILFRTAWVAAYLKNRFSQVGLELADGKLEWAVDEEGKPFLVDSIGPDELRILKGRVQLSKEFLRGFYRGTAWFRSVQRAQEHALTTGVSEWQKIVSENAPHLPASEKEVATQLYLMLANLLTGKSWFPEAWSLEKVVQEIENMEKVFSEKESEREIEREKKTIKQEPKVELVEKKRKTVLVVGSGAREHAIAWKLSLSPQVGRVILAPGNDAAPFEKWSDADLTGGQKGFKLLAMKAKEEKVDLAVIGPDDPLAEGIVDVFRREGVLTFGPTANAARIESSKAFAKEVMIEAGIDTASYQKFEDLDEALRYVKNLPWEQGGGERQKGWVVKANGLALGKGVKVCQTEVEAEEAVREFFPISKALIIEEKLFGKELSWMALFDGESFALLEPARDYKALLEKNQGPNTGGMGAFSPVPEVGTREFEKRVKEEVFEPALEEMKRRGIPFEGVLYAGLMWDEAEHRLAVLEFNARFGDPEAQVVLPRMDADLYTWLEAVVQKKLSALPGKVPFKKDFAVYVVGAAPGYPAAPEKGIEIKGPFGNGSCSGENLQYFCAGLRREDQKWLTAGGRIFGSLGGGSSLEEAREAAYAGLKKIDFPRMTFRKDIGAEESVEVI